MDVHVMDINLTQSRKDNIIYDLRKLPYSAENKSMGVLYTVMKNRKK